VSFDELSAFDLLQLLNDVLIYLDPVQHKVDLRDENQNKEGATATRMTDFLRMLKYQVPGDVESFKQSLSRGDRAAIYPALHYLLSRLEPMKTRAYLARFLVNVEVPPAFLHDEAIQDVYQQYKSLQREFKEVHKSVESSKHNTMQPGELKREIHQLEEEKTQLLEKINYLERKTDSIPGFTELYEATSALRKEQEEEAKVLDQGREQQAALEMSQQRLAQMQRRVDELQTAQRDDSPSELLARLDNEVRENQLYLEEQLPRELSEYYDKLGQIERALNEPAKTRSDVDEMDARVRRSQRDIENLQDQIDRARRLNGGDDKLKMFRQQSAMVSKKLESTQGELEEATCQVQQLDKEIMEKEKALGEISGPKHMKKHEFKKYANGLRQKTQEYKRRKAELESLRAETVVLNRTETIMRTRGANVEEFLKEVERSKGIEGAGETEQELNVVSQKASELNQSKSMTLEQISEIVRQLKEKLVQQKRKLAPQIQSLRAVRETFKSIEQEYTEKKSIYENTAVGLESDRIKLENECNANQQECLREESRFHYLNCLTAIADAQLSRVQDELRFQKGDGRLLRDFKSYKDLYNQKIQQQEQLSKELRKKQKTLKETAGESSEQRQLFVDLHRLLETKLKVKQQENQVPNGGSDGVLDLGQDIGGANIMRITEQGT